jgi:hypothetical protein
MLPSTARQRLRYRYLKRAVMTHVKSIHEQQTYRANVLR